MIEKKPVSKSGSPADWLLGGALARIGDTVDRFTGRRWIPSSTLATSELIARIKDLLDSEAKQIPEKGTVVPHNIKLKMQWDKFSTDSEEALAKLEYELTAAAADHINDSLYYTLAPLKVQVKPDYFIEGVKLLVNFDKFAEDEDETGEVVVAIPSINSKNVIPAAVSEPERPTLQVETFIARFSLMGSQFDKKLEFPAGGRISVGRTGGNELVIDNASISKIHAALVVGADHHLSVADTGSTNGTFINGQRISYGKATRLVEGDKVKFGEVKVTFEYIPQKVEAEIPVDEIANNTIAIDGFNFTTRISDQTNQEIMADKPIADDTLRVEIPEAAPDDTIQVQATTPVAINNIRAETPKIIDPKETTQVPAGNKAEKTG